MATDLAYFKQIFSALRAGGRQWRARYHIPTMSRNGANVHASRPALTGRPAKKHAAPSITML